MARRLNRDHFGPYFKEGSRQLWLLMLERNWAQTELAEALGTISAQVNKWLYGDRCPGRDAAEKIESVLGIPRSLWSMKPLEPFVLPAVRRRSEAAPLAATGTHS
jgi:transcriptional regulator with XRE-family HTH domain